LVAAQTAVQQDGLKIYTIASARRRDDLNPLTATENGGFVKDDAGSFVKSRLDEPALKAIAAATGGLYAPLRRSRTGIRDYIKAGLAPMPQHDLVSRRQKIYIQRYQWPLAGSLLRCSPACSSAPPQHPPAVGAHSFPLASVGRRGLADVDRYRLAATDGDTASRGLADAAAVSGVALLAALAPAGPTRAPRHAPRSLHKVISSRPRTSTRGGKTLS